MNNNVLVSLLRAEETLCVGKDLAEAVTMALFNLEDDISKKALLAVVSCLDENITKVLALLEQARGEFP